MRNKVTTAQVDLVGGLHCDSIKWAVCKLADSPSLYIVPGCFEAYMSVEHRPLRAPLDYLNTIDLDATSDGRSDPHP